MSVNKQRLVDEFIQLVSVDSPSLGERRMGDYLTQQLISLGFSVREDDTGNQIGGNCGNIYGFLDGEHTLNPIVFCAHMDTVEPSSGKQALLGEDGTIRSNGDTVLGADDCAGIASIIEALRAIREQQLPHRPIEVLLTVAEEIYCKGAELFDFSLLRSKEAYILDLTGPVGTVAYQAPTILSFDVTVRGKSSHAGFAPDKGVHAIKAAAEAIASLPIGRISEITTLNVGEIQGGRATNIVPELCVVSGEIRSYSHEQAIHTAQTVKEQFERAAKEHGAHAEFITKTCCHAYTTPLDHPVVRRYEETCKAMGLTCRLEPTFGGSDNNVFAAHGITGIVLACAMHQCHSCEEFTTVDELVMIAELTKNLMTSEVL